MCNLIYTNKRLFFLSVLLTIGLLSNSQDLRISELQALNSSTYADGYGEYSDWIEINNYGETDINLLGYVLTDDKSDLEKWEFPDLTLQAHSYILVFASGKNLLDHSKELHTNFKLSGSGEYLAIISPAGNFISEFAPNFPAQEVDLSWGYLEGGYMAFSQPTPGKANIQEASMVLPCPIFNKKHNIYSQAFEIEITSPVEGTVIYYTTNGNSPSKESGTIYKTPILVERNTVLRAVCTKESFEKSPITTQTYLFLDDIISQPNNPSGYPSEWGPYFEIEGFAIGDYEMDTEITKSNKYQQIIDDALLDLPVMSIVTDIGNLFSKSTDPDSGGIYIYTGPPENGEVAGLGDKWERPASVEYFSQDDPEGFQIDCGLRLHGGHSRRVEKTPKHSFRLAFRSEYGESKLNYPIFGNDAAKSFNTLILRAGFGNSFTHHSSSERNRAQYIRDQWGKETQRDMGHLSGKGNYVHLFLNGLYWGIYNPTERIDKSFAENYLGGTKEDYDIIKDYGTIVDGSSKSWEDMMKIINNDLLSANEVFEKVQGNNPDGSPNSNFEPYVDLVGLIDYMLINYYGTNWDWDQHNWVALRNRVEPEKGYQFFSWDAEHIIEKIDANVLSINNSNRPSQIIQRLKESAKFITLFADRVQLHCFNGGALTQQTSINRWMNLADKIDTAIVAESARWGDYRRDVHPWRTNGPFDIYSQQTWLVEQDYIINKYFPVRMDVFISQLKQAGFFPEVDAPEFFINNTPKNIVKAEKGDYITITSSVGSIFYTTDGSDPVVTNEFGNVPAQSAMKYESKIQIEKSTILRARVLSNNSWSALSDFMFSNTADFSNLKLTEIHYNPIKEDTIESGLFEFIELKNTGDVPLDLSSIEFTKAISYRFKEKTIIGPGKFVVIASSPINFVKRYSLTPLGKYTGRLGNSGEQIVLLNSFQDTILSVSYKDVQPWPSEGDGDGYSIVPSVINPDRNQNDGSTWRASLEINGSPGRDDNASTVIEEIPELSIRKSVLFQNYPSPASSETTIDFEISESGNVSLQLYDITGKKQIDIANNYFVLGNHSITFNTSALPDGLYLYKAKLNENVFGIQKILISK